MCLNRRSCDSNHYKRRKATSFQLGFLWLKGCGCLGYAFNYSSYRLTRRSWGFGLMIKRHEKKDQKDVGVQIHRPTPQRQKLNQLQTVLLVKELAVLVLYLWFCSWCLGRSRFFENHLAFHVFIFTPSWLQGQLVAADHEPFSKKPPAYKYQRTFYNWRPSTDHLLTLPWSGNRTLLSTSKGLFHVVSRGM